MIKITRKTKNLEKLARRLKELGKASVESGYFSENGNHPTADMSYASLMNIHEYGFTSKQGFDVPQRSVREPTAAFMKSKSSSWKKRLGKYVYGFSEIDVPLEYIGEMTTTYAQSVFGSTTMLTPNSEIYMSISGKGANTPLVFDGYLQANWSWKSTEHPLIHN